MIKRTSLVHQLIDCHDADVAGGKGVNLGQLIRIGAKTPVGFVISTGAYRAATWDVTDDGRVPTAPADVASEIVEAYRELGGGPVAVRSSATCEDQADSSLAGQFETFLNIEGEQALLAAVERCWASVNAPRVAAYLAEHKIDSSAVAMAVVVQHLISADVAGVLFTASPRPGEHCQMLIEANPGLGEAVVSGQVQPDLVRVDRATGRVLETAVGAGRVGLCIGTRDVDALWTVGRRLAEQFGGAQDIEWAIKDGELFVLQCRPITTDVASQEILDSLQRRLQGLAAAGRGPWALHNLAETLPHPTALTWSVIQTFMSGRGGFGAMYRLAGFMPSELVCRKGFLELAAGRIYMDASKAPEMFFEDFPFRYDVALLKNSPDAAQSPPTLRRGSIWSLMSATRQLKRIERRIYKLALSLDRQLREDRFPALREYVAAAKRIDLHSQPSEQLIELWQRREQDVLTDFGSWSLLPGLICGMALRDLKSLLEESIWKTDCEVLAQQLSVGEDLSQTLLSDSELYDVGCDDQRLDSWLAKYGHRAVGEFDLASPRWREQPAAARQLAESLASARNPVERHREQVAEIERLISQIEQRLPRTLRGEFRRRVELTRRFVICREDSKYYLMLGYDLLRDLALEAGRRLEIGDGVFHLTRDELFESLRTGMAPLGLIRQRQQQRRDEARTNLPAVIDPHEFSSPRAVPALSVADHDLRGLAISPGRASGAARILRSPTDEGGIKSGEVLVCTSTDPSWTPLFAKAAALVLETGGVLSHGAIVARELGIPAVVVSGSTQSIQAGELITVDGGRGLVHLGEGDPTPWSPTGDESDTFVPYDHRPPGPGRKDRIAGKWRKWLGLAWIMVLLAFFGLPESFCRQPMMSAMDWMLWPTVRVLGKPGSLLLVAALLAVTTVLVEVTLTDHRRLAEAKRRAKSLDREAAGLLAGSPRRAALKSLTAAIPLRSMSAAMVPIGVLLGPMILSMVWLSERMGPENASPPPGSAVSIVAKIDSDTRQPVRLEVPIGFEIDAATPAVQTLPSLRETLAELLGNLRRPLVEPSISAALIPILETSQKNAAQSLQDYLNQGIPAQGLTWSVRSPANAQGTFSATVTAGAERRSIQFVLGDQDPPLPTNVDVEPTARSCSHCGEPIEGVPDHGWPVA